MITFDWTNVILAFVLVAFIWLALNTEIPLVRFISHLVVLITLINTLLPIFWIIYGGFAGWHIITDGGIKSK